MDSHFHENFKEANEEHNSMPIRNCSVSFFKSEGTFKYVQDQHYFIEAKQSLMSDNQKYLRCSRCLNLFKCFSYSVD